MLALHKLVPVAQEDKYNMLNFPFAQPVHSLYLGGQTLQQFLGQIYTLFSSVHSRADILSAHTDRAKSLTILYSHLHQPIGLSHRGFNRPAIKALFTSCFVLGLRIRYSSEEWQKKGIPTDTAMEPWEQIFFGFCGRSTRGLLVVCDTPRGALSQPTTGAQAVSALT